MTRTTIALATLLAAGAAANAQSASVSVSASSANVAPGGSVTITVSADWDAAGAMPGIFGDAGFYGFGGNVVVSGDAAASASASSPMINADLTSGATSSVNPAPAVARAAAGRGLLGGVSTDPIDVLTLTLNIDSGATLGDTVTVDYAGAVVLNLGDSLVTYSTDPGANQQTLSTSSVTLTVGQGGCNAADLSAPFGSLTFADISAFLSAFTSMSPAADLAAPFGSYTFADISAFLGAFSAGCP